MNAFSCMKIHKWVKWKKSINNRFYRIIENKKEESTNFDWIYFPLSCISKLFMNRTRKRGCGHLKFNTIWYTLLYGKLLHGFFHLFLHIGHITIEKAYDFRIERRESRIFLAVRLIITQCLYQLRHPKKVTVYLFYDRIAYIFFIIIMVYKVTNRGGTYQRFFQ